MSCTDASAALLPLNTPLRRFAVSFAPTPAHNVKLRENRAGRRYNVFNESGWAGWDVLIRGPGETRGKCVVTAICRLNTPGVWIAPDGSNLGNIPIQGGVES